jgi:hypothetical protein
MFAIFLESHQKREYIPYGHCKDDGIMLSSTLPVDSGERIYVSKPGLKYCSPLFTQVVIVTELQW